MVCEDVNPTQDVWHCWALGVIEGFYMKADDDAHQVLHGNGQLG